MFVKFKTKGGIALCRHTDVSYYEDVNPIDDEVPCTEYVSLGNARVYVELPFFGYNVVAFKELCDNEGTLSSVIKLYNENVGAENLLDALDLYAEHFVCKSDGPAAFAETQFKSFLENKLDESSLDVEFLDGVLKSIDFWKLWCSTYSRIYCCIGDDFYFRF